MKATIKSECVIRGERYGAGEVVEVSEGTFEKLEKAGCAEKSTVAEKVVSGVKTIAKGGKGKGGKIINRQIKTGNRRKIRKSGDK